MTKSTALLLLCFAIGAFFHPASAQTGCSSALSAIDMSANEIQARIWTNGILFNEAAFYHNYNPNLPSNPSTIYSASLWLGGIDPAGNLRINCPDYGNGNAAGPLNFDGTTSALDCSNWDRLFIVSGNQIAAFLANLPVLANDPGAALAQYKNIMGWPGQGNPYFADAWGYDLPASAAALAPFYDANFDGSYNPLQGDYPVVELQGLPPFVPASMVWTVFNDSNTGSMGMETQLTAWQFDCPDNAVLNRTLFTSHKLIYRGTEPLDSCYAGIWVDFDLGCYSDDYVGSIPALDAFYVYNQDAVDGSVGATCDQGVTTFADNPPVQSVTMLNQSMDKFMYFNNTGVGSPIAATTSPTLPIEYYRYLTGHWRDGLPLTQGGSGYNPPSSIPADHAFPDPANSPTGWTMCTANLPFGDRQTIGIHKIGTLFPGAVNSFVTAWTVHPDVDLPCGTGATETEIEGIRSIFDDGFSTVCSPLMAVGDIPQGAVRIFPNPAGQTATVEYGDLNVREIRLFSSDGRLVFNGALLQPEQTVLDLAPLSNGMYTVQLLTERWVLTRKIAVVK